MRAILLAAGAGRRLEALTQERPKCMVALAGKSLLEHQLAALAQAGIGDVTVVTGYRADVLERFGYPTRHNPRYAVTNMVASLMCAADRLDGSDDVLIAYTDIVYEPRIVRAIIDCDAALAVTVDRSWLRLWRLRSDDPLRDAETLRLGEDGRVLELGKRPRCLAEIEGQYMGIIRASAAMAPRLVRFYEGLDPRGPYDGKDRDNMFMTSFLQGLIDAGQPLQAVLVDGGWLEVDTVADVEKYAELDRAGTLREICDLRTAI